MPGSADGATVLLKALVPGGIVPSSWNTKGQGPTDYPGGYRLTTFKPDASGTGRGTLQWGNFTPYETIQFTWNKNDRKLVDDSANIPDPGEVHQLPLLGIPDAISSGVGTVGELIGALMNASLWKRIGIGAIGVVIILIALVFILKKGVTS